MSKPTGRYAEGERNRQAIISYYLANPGNAVPLMIDSLMPSGMNEADIYQFRAIISARVKKMVSLGEISREKCLHPMINSHGKPISVATYRCWALVEKTRSAAEVYATMIQPIVDKPKPKPKQTKCEPWRTRSCDLRDPYTSSPIPNQGGQGSGRTRVYVGATAGML